MAVLSGKLNPRRIDRTSLRRTIINRNLKPSKIPSVVFSPEEVQKLSPLIRFIKARILFEKRLFKGEKSAKEILAQAKEKDKDFLRKVIELKSEDLENLTPAELLKIASGLSATYPSVSKWILENGFGNQHARRVSPVANLPYNQKLFEENKNLAYSIAHRFFRQHSIRLSRLGWDLDDVKQVALMGLARSTKTFDPDRKISSDSDRKIKLATYAVKNMIRLLRRMTSKKPDFPELEKLSMDFVDTRNGKVMSLDSIILPPKSSALEFDLTPEQLVEKIKKTSLISPREKAILLERMKIIRGHQQTFEDIGKRLGLTKSRIEQIEHSALLKISNNRQKFLAEGN
jgi:RNA polymerase sigma factor (sigma-70 family)